MSDHSSPTHREGIWPKALLAGGVLAGCAALVFVIGQAAFLSKSPEAPARGDNHRVSFDRNTPLAATGRLTLWWDDFPANIRERSIPSGSVSNIHPADYVGPDACKKCHPGNYLFWSTHPHRWMNAPANDATVKGDFSSGATITYRRGKAEFHNEADRFLMTLERDGVRRTYAITQTIGRRFFQYYVGKLIDGPEPKSHRFYAEDHVLPFGYWLDEKEWVPVVHIGPERADADRPDPFSPPDRGRHYAEYAASCNYCHTTFPLADMFGRRPHQIAGYAPIGMHFGVGRYLEDAHPDAVKGMSELLSGSAVENPMVHWEASHYAVTHGVSCEACHLGAKEHVASAGRVPPRFFPASPYLRIEATKVPDPGRTQSNLNWACGRCHVGARPTFAAGMSTWNSVEYSDAMLGSCYSQLRCVDCHEPHKEIGPKWKLTADQDDAKCIKCHDRFRSAAAIAGHSHHAAGSDGARCMNCHMPRINEGLQDVVRTHMIYSPTRADMIEANHPNACSLCHTDRPIDWTLGKLKEWYGKTYDDHKIAANYPERAASVGIGWLKSRNEAVRLVGADALARARDFQALPELIDALDDSHLLNRQFAARGLQGMLNVRLADFGYRFFMMHDERTLPLAELRRKYPGRSRPKAE